MPWKECAWLRMTLRPVYSLAIMMQLSTASVPDGRMRSRPAQPSLPRMSAITSFAARARYSFAIV